MIRAHKDKNFRASNVGKTARACPACGARARRDAAKFCSTCGRNLFEDESYFPTDGLRASYHASRRETTFNAPRFGASRKEPRECVVSFNARRAIPFSKKSAALAFAIYALVPLVGIIFCFLAFVSGVFEIVTARRAENVLLAMYAITFACVLFIAQIFMWGIALKLINAF